MASRASGGDCVSLSVNEKLELIKKLEAVAMVAHICEEYSMKKQALSDIQNAKDKFTALSLKFGVDSKTSIGGSKHMSCAI